MSALHKLFTLLVPQLILSNTNGSMKMHESTSSVLSKIHKTTGTGICQKCSKNNEQYCNSLEK